MLKTILRTVLIILVLAGVFFFALRMWEGKRGALPTATVPGTPEAAITVRQVSVVPTAEGALIQIDEVSGPGYTITPLDTGIGFVVDIPGAKVGMLQSSIPNPHPMIRNIDASQVFAQGAVHARIRVELAQEATHRDRLQASILYIDVLSKVTPTAAPTPELTPIPKPKPVAKSSKAKTHKPVAKKKAPSRRASHTVATSSPKRSAPPKPRATPAPMAKEGDSDALLRDLGIGSAPPAAAPAPEPVAPVKEPPPPALAAEAAPPAEATPAAPVTDLESLFVESQGGKPAEAAPPPAEEAPPKVAAIPPPEAGKFDSSQIARDLPALTALAVTSEGEATVIRFSREQSIPFKVFKMVNPNRITVDFKNSANHLKANYPAFPGTRVKKVTTQNFPGQDGLTRVTFFIDGLPKYESATEGNDLILKLP